jgi:transcriptional regulator with XRE-family HTH domain
VLSCQPEKTDASGPVDMAERRAWRHAFGERLKEAMDRANVNQTLLSQRVGVTRSAVNRWVSGHTDPDLPLVPRIATTLKVSLDWLFGLPGAEPPERQPPEIDVRDLLKIAKMLEGAEAELVALAKKIADHH